MGGARVLHGPGDLLVQGRGGMERPVWVAEKFARQQNDIRLAGANELVGLRRGSDHADGSGRDSSFVTDGLGVVNLVSGADGDLLRRVIASGGDVDEVDAFVAEVPGEVD